MVLGLVNLERDGVNCDLVSSIYLLRGLGTSSGC